MTHPPIQPTAEQREAAEEIVSACHGNIQALHRCGNGEKNTRHLCYSSVIEIVVSLLAHQQSPKETSWVFLTKFLDENVPGWPDNHAGLWVKMRDLLAQREALAAYSASQEVLRSVEEAPDGYDYDQRKHLKDVAAKTACEKFPKPL